MRQLQLWLLVVAGAACAGSSPPPAKPPQGEALPSARVATSSVIDLRPFTITFQGRPIARLLADGRTESVGPNGPGHEPLLPGPTLRRDGTILLTKGGFTARVESNGDIYVVGPPGTSPRERLFGRIAGNRLSVASSETPGVRVDDATIVFDRPGTPNEIGKIEGVVDASARHTALVMTAAFFIDMAITAQ